MTPPLDLNADERTRIARRCIEQHISTYRDDDYESHRWIVPEWLTSNVVQAISCPDIRVERSAFPCSIRYSVLYTCDVREEQRWLLADSDDLDDLLDLFDLDTRRTILRHLT